MTEPLLCSIRTCKVLPCHDLLLNTEAAGSPKATCTGMGASEMKHAQEEKIKFMWLIKMATK